MQGSRYSPARDPERGAWFSDRSRGIKNRVATFHRLPGWRGSGKCVSRRIHASAEIATLQRVALALAAFVMSGGAQANDSRVERMLQQLDPDARFEQVCDLEAMK